MKKPIPVTVVSGFLGSGKTTLLCDLLRRRQELRLAVLINELGEVSIDGALARASTSETQEVEIVDFPSGLIAYAEDDQFVPTLQAIARRAGRVDHVLIETSGVALPTAAMARLQATELVDSFVLDATLVVVDTPRLLAGEFDGVRESELDATRGAADGARGARAAGGAGGGSHNSDRRGYVDVYAPEGGPRADGARSAARNPCVGESAQNLGDGGSVRKPDAGEGAPGHDCEAGVGESVRQLFDLQLGAADVVVLNKIDELDTDALLVAEEQVRGRAPNVRFLELAHHARLDVRVALGLRLHQVAAGPGRMQHFRGPFAAMPGSNSLTLADHGRVDGHSHSGLAAHLHGLTTHTHFHERDPGWLSFTLRSGERQSVGALRTALEQVAQAEPLLRCKGFALASEGEHPVLFQGVRTRVVATEQAPKSQVKESELVFIGYHLSRSRVASMLSRLTGTAWS